MSYTILKTIHLTCALATYMLFFARGVWLFSDPPRLSLRWVRVVPHIIDSILLLSAIGLVLVTHQYPGEQTWLNAKLVALVLYIVLGIAALRLCHSRVAKLITWVLAQMVFFYIVFVAITRTIYFV